MDKSKELVKNASKAKSDSDKAVKQAQALLKDVKRVRRGKA